MGDALGSPRNNCSDFYFVLFIYILLKLGTTVGKGRGGTASVTPGAATIHVSESFSSAGMGVRFSNSQTRIIVCTTCCLYEKIRTHLETMTGADFCAHSDYS